MARQPTMDREALRNKSRWIPVTLKMPPELVIELERLAVEWDYYRYEVIAELLVFALERIETGNYQPALFPP